MLRTLYASFFRVGLLRAFSAMAREESNRALLRKVAFREEARARRLSALALASRGDQWLLEIAARELLRGALPRSESQTDEQAALLHQLALETRVDDLLVCMALDEIKKARND